MNEYIPDIQSIMHGTFHKIVFPESDTNSEKYIEKISYYNAEVREDFDDLLNHTIYKIQEHFDPQERKQVLAETKKRLLNKKNTTDPQRAKVIREIINELENFNPKVHTQATLNLKTIMEYLASEKGILVAKQAGLMGVRANFETAIKEILQEKNNPRYIVDTSNKYVVAWSNAYPTLKKEKLRLIYEAGKMDYQDYKRRVGLIEETERRKNIDAEKRK